MGMMQRWLQNRGYFKLADINPPDWAQATAEHEQYSVPDGALAKNQATLYQKLTWVQTAVHFVAKSVATTPLRVKKRVGEKIEDVPNHPFEELLENPNPLQSRHDFIESYGLWLNLTGNHYCWMNAPSATSPPDEMWTMRPYYVKPVPDGNLYLSGYAYEVSGYTEMLPCEDVSHTAFFHPTNSFVGLSPIEALSIDAVGDLNAQKYNTKFFASDAQLPGMLRIGAPLIESEKTKVKAAIKRNAQTRSTMILWGMQKDAAEWLTMGVSQKDMEFLKGREFTRDEIFMMYGVFPGLFSDVSGKAAGGNARANYQEYTLWPLLQKIAGRITKDILQPRYGEQYIAAFDDVRQVDQKLELEQRAIFAQYRTIDELRELDGLEPIGDERGEMLEKEIPAGQGLFDEDAETGNTPAQLMPFTGQEPPEQDAQAPPEQDEQEAESVEPEEPNPAKYATDLSLWQKKAVRIFLRDGSGVCKFDSSLIPVAIKNQIAADLASADSAQAVRDVFRYWTDDAEQLAAMDSLAAAISAAAEVV